MANIRPVKIVDIGEGKAEIHEFQNDDKIDNEFIDAIIARIADNNYSRRH